MTPLVVAAVAVGYFLVGIAVATWVVLDLSLRDSDIGSILVAILFWPLVLVMMFMISIVFAVVRIPLWFARRIQRRQNPS